VDSGRPDERGRLLDADVRSVAGDPEVMDVLFEYTLALLEHLKGWPIRVE
jgi:hypothetical protein